MQVKNHFSSFSTQIFFIALLAMFGIAVVAAVAESPKHAGHLTNGGKPADVVRDPSDLPPPVGNRSAGTVRVELTAREITGTLDASAGTTYHYWTFNGKVPGPMVRVRQGDMVEVTLHNDANSHMVHSLDFHAALGQGGGAALSQVTPGQSKTFTFDATTPGLFVYHCGTQMIAEHIANGMYGLILVEPPGGLPKVDHEYYVMQGEIYTMLPKGNPGFQQFSLAKLMGESPEYFLLNGAVDALTTEFPMHAKVGETVRVFFGNAGPNATASIHVVGEIFTRVYELGSLTSSPLTGVQTAGVPPGAAAVLEFEAKLPGKFTFMDHAMSRMAKGDMAIFDISGPENAALMHSGPVTSDQRASLNGITPADDAANRGMVSDNGKPSSADARSNPQSSGEMAGMDMSAMVNTKEADAAGTYQQTGEQADANSNPGETLDGCLTVADNGRVMLNIFRSKKTYRLEGKPLEFSKSANRFVHVSGYFGSVMAVEDPALPSFVVNAIDEIAPECSGVTAAQIHKALLEKTQATRGLVGMSDMGFEPRTLVIHAGETVFWKNTSAVTHDVTADPKKALYRVDISLPSGASSFKSAVLQPGQSFSHVFTTPGIYRYVCTLHEILGMKGIIIVKSPQVLSAER